MEKTISRILDIEEKAKVILGRASEQKVMLHDEYEQKITNMEKEIVKHNAVKIEEYKTAMEKELHEEELILIQKSDRQRKELEEFYTVQHTTIANQVFEDIIRS